MVYTIKNGLEKAYLAPVTDADTWGEIFELGDLIEYSFETAENTSELSAGNSTVYSFKGIGSSSGTITVPAIDDETYAKIYNTKKNAKGDLLYAMNSLPGKFCLVLGVTAKNSTTGAEITEYMALPSVTFGLAKESGQTKNTDGTETLQTIQLSYTATALDNKVYKAKLKTKPTAIATELFTPSVA